MAKKEKMRKKVISEAEKKQRNRYQINLKLDPEKDKDIIMLLKMADKKQTFIKDCIRHFDKVWEEVI